MINRRKNQTDLTYIVDYNYERSGCHCNESICRCTTIENARVDEVNVSDVFNELYLKHVETYSAINEYCFERICYLNKIFDKSEYTVETCSGYYGEEVYGVFFDGEEAVNEIYNEILALEKDIDKIKKCLELEYGYLSLPVQAASSAEVIEVPVKKRYCPQMEYMRKLEKDVIDEYKCRDLPVAVCIKNGNKYTVVDGYHRYLANKMRDKVKIVVLE